MNNLNEQGFQTDAKPGEQGYCARNNSDPKNPTELRMPSLSEVTKPTFQNFCLTIQPFDLCSKFQSDPATSFLFFWGLDQMSFSPPNDQH